MTILILTDNVHAHALAVDLQARHGDMDVYQSPSASCRVSRDVMSQSASRKSWSGMTSSFPSTVNRGFPPL